MNMNSMQYHLETPVHLPHAFTAPIRPQITTVSKEKEELEEDEEKAMPLLVYVSREKRRASPHHFKAGALNALVDTVTNCYAYLQNN
jgi:hypothetical protein